MARPVFLLGLCAFLLPAQAALAASEVHGFIQADGVTGRPNAAAAGWQTEYLYLGQLSVGYGAGCTSTARPLPVGWFNIKGIESGIFPGGTYALFALCFDGSPAFSFRNDVVVPAGSTILDPIYLKTPAHYSVMYSQEYTEWGSSPWIWGSDMYQTFVATSPHITRLVTRLAGKSGDHQVLFLNMAVHQTNAGAPSTWPRISPIRSFYMAGTTDPIIILAHLAFRSNELTLVTGETYAVRFWVGAGSGSTSFAMVARTDNNNGYAGGQLYVDGVAHPELDAFGYFSGGQSGTLVNHAPVTSTELLQFAGFNTRQGQTLRASGAGLAGADLTYATGDVSPPSLSLSFQLYDQVGGTPIGPAKRCYGVPGFYQARAAVFWNKGEAPITPGQMYYLEWTSPGMNIWCMNEDVPGAVYVNRVALDGTSDAMMSIAEYEATAPPPVAGFTADPLTGAYPLTVTFTDQSTGQIDDRSWDFGDTGTSTETNPVHVYERAGTYTVMLTVTGPGGANTKSRIGYITVAPSLGDYDRDGDVDQEDWGKFQTCITGTGNGNVPPDCWFARLDSDADVDKDDVAIFIRCHTASGVQADASCLNP